MRVRGIGVSRFRRSLPAAVAIAVAVVIVAGCGGGGSSSSSGSGGGGDFASGAEAACANANKQIAALGVPEEASVLEYLEGTEAVIEKLHSEIAALGSSGSAEREYTNALAKSVTVINEMSNAARSENLDAVRELSNSLVDFHLGELAEAAELKTCAEVPVSSS
jgi:hypothetical protein